MTSSHHRLLIISAVVWYAGAVALLLKGGALITAAHAIGPHSLWTYLSVPLGLGVGWVKSRWFFRRSCERNIQRILALERPRIWQFFRPGLLLFLAIIIPTGAWMSSRAAGNHFLLCLVGALDLSIGCALLASSRAYWPFGVQASTKKRGSQD